MTITTLCENLGGAGVVLKGRRKGSGNMEGRGKIKIWGIGEREKLERGKRKGEKKKRKGKGEREMGKGREKRE
jgi:hypothetical protein